MKFKPKISISFTNGLPKERGGQGFDTSLEGDYGAVLALVDEMRKAIVTFREIDNKRW